MEINDKFDNVKLKMVNTDSVIFSMPAKNNLSEKITISNENGEWKHQLKNCHEITHFYSLSPVCYNLSYTTNQGLSCQLNKICGFNFQSCSTKVDSKDFEELLTKALKDQYLGIKLIKLDHTLKKI